MFHVLDFINFKASDIKDVSLKYCQKVLKRNEPKAGFRKMFEMREELNEERLKGDDG